MLQRGEAVPGDPSRFLNLVHIDDAVQASVAALDAASPTRLYLVSDDRPVARKRVLLARGPAARCTVPQVRGPPRCYGEAARDDVNRRISNRRMRDRSE